MGEPGPQVSSPATEEIAALRSQELYVDAAAACKAKDYPQALHLLNSLSQRPGLIDNQKSFVAQQIDVVHKDAGLRTTLATTIGHDFGGAENTRAFACGRASRSSVS